MTATDVIEQYAAACQRSDLKTGLIVEVWLYDQQQHLVDRAWSQP